jgi:hypothetical protein
VAEIWYTPGYARGTRDPPPYPPYPPYRNVTLPDGAGLLIYGVTPYLLCYGAVTNFRTKMVALIREAVSSGSGMVMATFIQAMYRKRKLWRHRVAMSHILSVYVYFFMIARLTYLRIFVCQRGRCDVADVTRRLLDDISCHSLCLQSDKWLCNGE